MKTEATVKALSEGGYILKTLGKVIFDRNQPPFKLSMQVTYYNLNLLNNKRVFYVTGENKDIVRVEHDIST